MAVVAVVIAVVVVVVVDDEVVVCPVKVLEVVTRLVVRTPLFAALVVMLVSAITVVAELVESF